ncbi:predicted protein [Verticillium alfalfae VaMs.102]|uniref:Predicted protein n=1 Tax=Verticillium alfalfae (strain VaMs.102 / ATCC MYA-4576 / FGSC 10136) TaxID=526221 RepID=C9SCF8_VERA1|nr:predicted protein [Verticillium alfalfae VaMs.102]EEY16773.1 predicted protein [Verticillium alfalfae VaMs.102]
MYRLAVSLLALASTGHAADCLRDQERQHSEPSGEQIAKAVGLQSDLENICAGNWRVNDEEKLTNSFNHWAIIYTVKREDNTKPLQHCMAAFNNILDQCVSNGNYWGGTWSHEGETYSISNSVSPENGLAPTDEGGPDVDSGPHHGGAGAFRFGDGVRYHYGNHRGTDHPFPDNHNCWRSCYCPTDLPACVDANDAVKEDLSRWTTRGIAIWLGGSATSVNELLYKLRETVCGGTCKAPDGVDSKYAAVYQSNGACEVSIAVSSEIEVYVNRDTWPDNNNDFNTIWQQCWDSTENIIDKCVDNRAKSGWWNGDHVYQFYQAGVRQLNDPEAHHTKNNIKIGSYLMPPTDGLSCGKDCHGFIPNPQWCRDNCGARLFARGRRWASSSNNPGSAPLLFARATETVNTVGGCNLRYVLPDYPSSGTAENNAAVQKFYDRDDTNHGNGNNCDNPVLTGPVAKVNGHSYDIGGQQAFDDSIDPNGADPVATCPDVEAVFNQLNAQGTHFTTETAAQQLGRAVSCSGPQCPDNNRVSELFLLRKEVNGIKNRIFTGHYTGIGRDPNDNKLPSCNPIHKTYVEMQQQMINAAMVFQYMNKQETFDAFNAVHLRIRQILTNLDADALGTNTPPRNLAPYIREGVTPTWLAAYDEFMNRFLVDTERKMGLWQRECRDGYDAAVLASNLQPAQKDAVRDKVRNYASGNGVYADAALTLSGLWDPVKGN